MSSINDYNSTQRWFILALLIWATTVCVGGYQGLFVRIPLVWIAPLVVAGIMTPVLVYYLNENVRSYVTSINLKYLTLFNIWRIPAGIAFLYYGSRNLLPEQFVRNAAFGDLAVGLLVPIVLMLRSGMGKYLAFHIVGLLDFVVAVGTGLVLTLLQVPLIDNIRTFPLVLIPLFRVCITGALHIMTLDILLRRKAIKQLS